MSAAEGARAVSVLAGDEGRALALSSLTAAISGFCSRQAMSEAQERIAIEIAAELFASDMAGSGRTAAASAEHLESLLARHAVERPPRSRGTFMPSEAVALYDFLIAIYVRHLALFKVVGTAVPELWLTQVNSAGTQEPPPILPPLADAIRLPA